MPLFCAGGRAHSGVASLSRLAGFLIGCWLEPGLADVQKIRDRLMYIGGEFVRAAATVD
jgi:hypothetical protein